MLTIQYSVWTEIVGRAKYAADTLQFVRSNCLLRTSHTPFGWILTLRAHGRRIRNNATHAGYVSWTEDFSQLSFKDIRFNLTRFRTFLQTELSLLDDDLHQLSLYKAGSEIPTFDLAQIKDNAANQECGWSFLQGETLQQWKRSILERVLNDPDLQRRFFRGHSKGGQLPTSDTWDTCSAQEYLKIERQFLTRLALLLFILGGQPPRGTELFSIRFRNTVSGGGRNLYIDHGLVSFVTSYHKGYSIDGSLKLIHRYLTPELSQILVQYLVLILPFVEQLNNLVFRQSIDSSFLWAKKETTWDTSQLSDFFATETIRELGQDSRLTVSSWRHIAIAVSREFLPKGECFNRVADKETMSIIDQQAGHSDLTAATTYGRLVEEGHGQIRQFRERYRRITRKWQSFWLDTPVQTSIPQPVDQEIESFHEHRFEPLSDPPPELPESPPLSRAIPDHLLDSLPAPPANPPSDPPFDLPEPQQIEPPRRSDWRPRLIDEGISPLPKEVDPPGASSTILRQQRLLQQFLIQQQEVQGQQQHFQLTQLMQLIQPQRKRDLSETDFEDSCRSKRVSVEDGIRGAESRVS